MSAGRGAAVLAGLLAAFIAAVDLARAIRPGLLLDEDPFWALPRLFLWWFLVAGTATAAGLAAAVFLAWNRGPAGNAAPPALPFAPRWIVVVGVAAFAFGAAARFLWLERLPPSLWIDDVSLLTPTLSLQGGWRDFADAVRPVPFGMREEFGTVGVLYLEAYRLSLLAFGTTVFGVRFLSALAGALSIVTAGLLGRALLPRGGGVLAALTLSGLRWHLIMSRWGWVAMVLTPLTDLAALMLIRARRRGRAGPALAAGAVAGIGAHVYLSAWIAGLGLGALCLWPKDSGPFPWPRRLAMAIFFAGGFSLAAAPLFLLREGNRVPYFARTRDHNVLKEVRYRKSSFVPTYVAADFLKAPWFAPDPTPRHDVPGRSRLGWLLGIPFAVGVIGALRWPRLELSAYLLTQIGAAFLGAVAGGESGNPNGFRFAYLTTPVAIGVAAGTLRLLALVGSGARRTAGLAAVGLLWVAAAAGTRDALLVWGESRPTFDDFRGESTLIGRAALRWERYGSVEVSFSGEPAGTMVRAIRRYRLDLTADGPAPVLRRVRHFRIVPPEGRQRERERVVEHVRDAWGREWAVVLGKVVGGTGSAL